MHGEQSHTHYPQNKKEQRNNRYTLLRSNSGCFYVHKLRKWPQTKQQQHVTQNQKTGQPVVSLVEQPVIVCCITGIPLTTINIHGCYRGVAPRYPRLIHRSVHQLLPKPVR